MRGIYELETLRDSSGNAVVVTGATVTVRKESDGLIAQIYNAVSGGSLLANPLTIAGSTIQFYAEQNERYRIDITSGTLTRTIRYQSVSIDTVTVKTEAATASAGQVTAHNENDDAHGMSASGRAVLRGTPAEGRTALQLGNSATLNVGVVAGTVAAGDDARFGVMTTSATAGVDLGGQRVAVISSGLAVYADNTDPTHANKVLGITTGAATNGQPVIIQSHGGMTEPSWTWTLNQPVFLSTTGLLTQTPPTTGFSQIVGFPTSATSLFINIREPLILN